MLNAIVWAKRIVMAAILALSAAWLVQAQEPLPRVSVAIVLAADVSGSINDDRFKIQRDGYAAAMRHWRVHQAIDSTARRAIAVTLVEWSGANEQRVVVPWMVIASEEDGDRFAALLGAAPRSFSGSTAVAAALNFVALQLNALPFQADRLVVDVSGDGIENSGGDVAAAREALVLAGATVNGIAILGEQPPNEQPLDDWYRENVAGGPGGFVMIAHDFDVFAYAMVGKLVREVAGDGVVR
jgi:hypothetical protein